MSYHWFFFLKISFSFIVTIMKEGQVRKKEMESDKRGYRQLNKKLNFISINSSWSYQKTYFKSLLSWFKQIKQTLEMLSFIVGERKKNIEYRQLKSIQVTLAFFFCFHFFFMFSQKKNKHVSKINVTVFIRWVMLNEVMIIRDIFFIL